MTISRAALAAKRVIEAAWQNGPSYDLASQAAFALESACLLNSPEIATELLALRARVAELEAATPATTAPAPYPQKTRYAIEIDDAHKLAPLMTVRHASLDTARERLDAYLARFPRTPYRIVRWDETSSVVETGCGGELPEALIASSGAVIETTRADDARPQVAELRALLAGQREDVAASPLHHDYRIGRDLPEVRP